MALQACPAIPIDLTPKQVFESGTVILHFLSLDAPTITFQYWITTRSIIPMFVQNCQEAGYNVLYFTPFSTKAAWTRLYPNQPVTNTIFNRLAAADPLPLPCRSFLMSTSPTPETPPSHNSLSNAPVKPTTALIAMIQQTLQQNGTLIVHLQNQPSPTSVQQTPIAPTYKPQRLLFPKCYRTPPTTCLFFTNVPSYKS